MWSTLGWLLACRPDPGPVAPHLVINEVLARNDGAWSDVDGDGECPDHDDFVEIYNPSREPLAYGGLGLTDDPNEPAKFVLAAGTLEPGGYLVVVADGEPEQGDGHAPFSISADGESVVLTLPGGGVLDRVDLLPQDSDVSWARWGDGAATFRAQTPSAGAANEEPPTDPCLQPQPGFDDHTFDCIASEDGFSSLAQTRAGLSVVKFEILSFGEARRHAIFLDSRFYELHDEWYIFRMMNGREVEGEDLFEPFDGDFATLEAIYAFLRTDVMSLFPPLFLTWTPTDRLTSPRFYDLVLDDPAVIGAGTLLHIPGVDGAAARYAFELEFTDLVTHEDVSTYFEVLDEQVAPEIGDTVSWLVRSTEQEALAQEMEALDLPYADRLLRYTDLTTPGTTEVYRAGTIAGRVRIVRAGQPGLEDSTYEDVLVLEEIPDYLPPCAALITTVPQTPLAHIALLAESRGVPNLHVAGLSDDPQWDSWGRIRTPIALRATLPDGLEAVQITTTELVTWQALTTPATPVLPTIDVDALPFTLDLTTVPFDDMPTWRLGLGGKSAGMIGLLGIPGVETPERPLAISIRGYHAHLATLPWVEEILGDPAFGQPGDPRARFLVLEGREAYDTRYPGTADATFRDDFLLAHPVSTEIGALAHAEGARGSFLATPLAAAVLDPIEDAVVLQFAALAPTQGLRFRSSSNVEDVEGFNGAGLYASYTGYLDPSAADDPDAESVEAALLQTWGSYWGAEAFEERHAAGIAHEDGGMGALVHPNFDDDEELSNGVITATRSPDGGALVVVNSHPGALSVTNPPVDACVLPIPEVDEITQASGEPAPTITRRGRSSESPDADVLDDAELLGLFDQSMALVDAWLALVNVPLPPVHQRSTLTLDLEYREMSSTWPDFLSGATSTDRLVLKQARSLEPSTSDLPEDLVALPFPGDLLARASDVTEAVCGSASFDVVVLEAHTEPGLAPDMGYTTTPFVASVTLVGVATLDHPDLETVDHPVTPWSVDVSPTAAAALATGVVQVSIDDAAITVDLGSGPISEPLSAPCVFTTLWASPDGYLDELIDR